MCSHYPIPVSDVVAEDSVGVGTTMWMERNLEHVFMHVQLIWGIYYRLNHVSMTMCGLAVKLSHVLTLTEARCWRECWC